MKYIITESRLNQAIYEFMDDSFASKDGSPKIFKLPSMDSDGAPLPESFDFVNSDYYEENGEPLFTWTGEEYWKTIYAQGYITKYEYEGSVKEFPSVEILDDDVIVSLNGYFGDLWIPVFKEWFKDKTGMDYKTLNK